jgi:hypothetical protein
MLPPSFLMEGMKMKLSDSIAKSCNVEDSIRRADVALDGKELDRLQTERASIILTASHRKPTCSAEVTFLCDLIAEYIEFVADEPASQSDRDEALTAIVRIAHNLKSAPLSPN